MSNIALIHSLNARIDVLTDIAYELFSQLSQLPDDAPVDHPTILRRQLLLRYLQRDGAQRAGNPARDNTGLFPKLPPPLD